MTDDEIHDRFTALGIGSLWVDAWLPTVRALIDQATQAAEAERDEARKLAYSWAWEVAKAQRQVADLRALHVAASDFSGKPVCWECGQDYPCATIDALDSAQPQDTPQDCSCGGDAATEGCYAEACRSAHPATPQDTD